ncbi:hypothetical protein ACFZC5_26500 [Nocardia gamkensis]|uniref:hypothetical protein n=1 Tax=Nocardia gamkensis TaxID=352869 RepID=UPI0036EB198D
MALYAQLFATAQAAQGANRLKALLSGLRGDADEIFDAELDTMVGATRARMRRV